MLRRGRSSEISESLPCSDSFNLPLGPTLTTSLLDLRSVPVVFPGFSVRPVVERREGSISSFTDEFCLRLSLDSGRTFTTGL